MRKYIPEKRKFPRRASFIVGSYTVKEGTFTDVIKNIGAGGLFVKTWRNIGVGQSIKIRFPLFDFDSILEVSGEVVISDATGFSIKFNQPVEGLICKEGHFPEIVHEADRPEKMSNPEGEH